MEAELQRHAKPRNYRVRVQGARIEVYERDGIDEDDLIAELKRSRLLRTGLDELGLIERLEELRDRNSQFSSVLRFILSDPRVRTFRTERMCYLSSIDDFIDVGHMGTIEQLTRELIPKLGTDAFFELY